MAIREKIQVLLGFENGKYHFLLTKLAKTKENENIAVLSERALLNTSGGIINRHNIFSDNWHIFQG